MADWWSIAFLSTVLVLVTQAQPRFTREEILNGTLKTRKLPTNECGESSEATFEKKVIGGEPVELGTYPWMAAIGYTANGLGPYWNCGGSLITDQYVVTAAHCVDPARLRAKRPFTVSVVRLGDLNLDDKVDDHATPLDVAVEKIVMHPQYSNVLKINDIALLKLRKKVTFTDLIKPICLPPPVFRTKSFVGYTPLVTGWGKVSLDGSATPTHLQHVEVDVQDLLECRRNISTVLPQSVLDERVICASAENKDSCQGDSGGPLMLSHRYNGWVRMFLLGIVSYGHGCALEGYPGVYTRVSEHMAWIIDNLDI